MTVAFFISPQIVPAIGSDIIITRFVDQSERRQFSRKPGDLIRGMRNKKFYHDNHARKTYILDNKTAVSFAGQKSTGLEIIREFNFHEDRNNKQPMRLLGDIANRYIGSGDPRLESQFLGIEVLESTSSGFSMNQVSYDKPFDLEKLGKTAVIGSGKLDFLEQLKAIDGEISFDSPVRRDTNPIVLGINDIIGSMSRISSNTLFEDIFLDGGNPSYGGFIDYCFYNPFRGEWVRQPDCLHLFVELRATRHGEFESTLHPYAVGYRSESTRSGIICVSGGEEGVVETQNLFDPLHTGEMDQFLPADWSNWTPEVVTINLFSQKVDGTYGNIGVKTFPGEICHFSVEPKSTEIFLEDNAIREFSEIVIRDLFLRRASEFENRSL